MARTRYPKQKALRHQAGRVTTMRFIDSNGYSEEEKEVLHRYYGDMPVVELDAPLDITVTAADCAGAASEDPEHCAIARAAERSHGSKAVVIFKRFAYIDKVEPDGTKRRLYRGELSPKAREVVSKFDTGQSFPTTCIRINPPLPSLTLEATRARDRAYREKLAAEGKKRSSGRTGGERNRTQTVIRSGTGQVKTTVEGSDPDELYLGQSVDPDFAEGIL